MSFKKFSESVSREPIPLTEQEILDFFIEMIDDGFEFKYSLDYVTQGITSIDGYTQYYSLNLQSDLKKGHSPLNIYGAKNEIKFANFRYVIELEIRQDSKLSDMDKFKLYKVKYPNQFYESCKRITTLYKIDPTCSISEEIEGHYQTFHFTFVQNNSEFIVN